MGADQTEQAQITTTRTDHVGLTVLDLEVARRLFCECLGWKVVGGDPSHPAAFVSDGHDRITLGQVQGPIYIEFDKKKSLGLHHLALKVSDIEGPNIPFRKVLLWPGVAVEFEGTKVHFMVAAPGGIRIGFARGRTRAMRERGASIQNVARPAAFEPARDAETVQQPRNRVRWSSRYLRSVLIVFRPASHRADRSGSAPAGRRGMVETRHTNFFDIG